MISRRILMFPLAMLGALALSSRCPADTNTDQLKADAQAALQKTEAAAKDAAKVTAEKAGEIATNVEAHAKPYVEKAGEVATNVAAETRVAFTNATEKTREVVTNATEKVKEEVHNATQ
jgi:ElaB/YqjD/DUF883 family membrane-anchored ribosome-binding protein